MDAKWCAVGAVSMLLFTAASVVHYLEAPNVVDPAALSVVSGAVGTVCFAQLYRQHRRDRSARSLR